MRRAVTRPPRLLGSGDEGTGARSARTDLAVPPPAFWWPAALAGDVADQPRCSAWHSMLGLSIHRSRTRPGTGQLRRFVEMQLIWGDRTDQVD